MTNTETVRAGFAAYAAADRAAYETLMAPDFHFTSPLDYRLDHDGYFERCWPERAPRPMPTFIAMAESGPNVFVTYEDKKPDGTPFRNTEVHTVRNGKLADIGVYFGWDIPKDAPARQ